MDRQHTDAMRGDTRAEFASDADRAAFDKAEAAGRARVYGGRAAPLGAGLPDAAAGETAWRAAWKADANLRAEFAAEDDFLALMRSRARR